MLEVYFFVSGPDDDKWIQSQQCIMIAADIEYSFIPTIISNIVQHDSNLSVQKCLFFKK